jgi:N-acetylmuramoyl-L-alanine amidase
MRDISEIIVHCSATPEGRDVKTSEIRAWHTRDNGWSDIGYHFVVELDGAIGVGRPQTLSGAHCKGKNSTSVGVCYIGGVDDNGNAKDTRNQDQKVSLETLLDLLKKSHPSAIIYGHRDFSDKPCPSFDAKSEYAHIGD